MSNTWHSRNASPSPRGTSANAEERGNCILDSARSARGSVSLSRAERTPPLGPTVVRMDNIRTLLEQSGFRPLSDYSTGAEIGTPITELPKEVKNFAGVVQDLGMKLYYIKSGSTGHTFRAEFIANPQLKMAVKVSAYPKGAYGDIDDLRRPENAELVLLCLLSNFVSTYRTPHLVLPITSFRTQIEMFTNMPAIKDSMYCSFVDGYHRKVFEPYVSVLFSEWCEGGDLLDYIRDHRGSIPLEVWKVLLFQILVTLASIQRQYPSFRHNDLKANNILLQKTENRSTKKLYRYRMGNHIFLVPHVGLEAKIWDFDFASIDGVVDNSKIDADYEKIHNISQRKNQYYDIHYLFSSLLKGGLVSKFDRKHVPPQVIDFMERVVPTKLQPEYQVVEKEVERDVDGVPTKVKIKKREQVNPRLGTGGRIKSNREYTTPKRVLESDPFFASFRRIGTP